MIVNSFMMIKFILWLFTFCLVTTVMGQKANYKQAERFLNLGSLVGTTSIIPNALKGTDKFWYKYQTGDGVHYYLVDPSSKTQRELFDRERVAGEISRVTHKPINYKDLKISGVRLEKGNDVVYFTSEKIEFQYDARSGKVIPADSVKVSVEKKKKGENKKLETSPKNNKTQQWNGTYSPDSCYTVYAKRHNLYLFCVRDSSEIQLTTDGTPECSYAGKSLDTTGKKVAAPVEWLAGSKYFYVEREDKRKMESLYLVNTVTQGRPTLNEYKYSMPGDKNIRKNELHVFSVDQRKEVEFPIEKWKDQTLTVYKIGKPVKNLYLLRKKRTCDEVEFCRVIPETGEVKVVIHEKCEPYFNDQLFNVHLLHDGEEIVWWSERTGHGHYYRYDKDGNLKNVITSGGWTAGKIVKVDTVKQTLYFEAYGQKKGEFPYFALLNKVRLDGKGDVQLLTPELATHKVHFLAGGRYFVDNFSRVDMEPRSVLRNSDGKIVLELASPDLSRLYETGWKMPEPFTVKAADNMTDLYGYMWKPADFDSTKRYPIISYVYPGPQTEAVPFEFSVVTAFNNAALAQVGFIVVTFGHRGGSPLRDRWYHTYGYGNLRDYPLADDKYGLEQLIDRYPFIDGERVGIFGHSGGGFMSTAAICTYPDFYKAAVSSAGNHDNNIYNIWWGETHHGIKERVVTEKKKVKNPVTGKDSTITVKTVEFEKPNIPTNIELASRLKGHLLLVAGDADNNVHPANTMRMVDALMKAGKNFDMFILPGQGHGYRGIALDFFKRKLWFHFGKYLLDDHSSEGFNEIDAYMRLK